MMKTMCLIAIALCSIGCSKKDDNSSTTKAPLPEGPPRAAISAPWQDGFKRSELGADYLATSKHYRIDKGALNARGAHNHPLWLRKKLPRNVVIEFDTWSNSAAGDIKVEVFGDGRSHATTRGAYTATGYVFIFGGWNNSKSLIARKDEHGGNMAVDKTKRKVVPRKRYHWKIVRKDKHIDWYIDDKVFLSYDDAKPLEGPGHEYFGFNNWESDLWFDNLMISPAK